MIQDIYPNQFHLDYKIASPSPEDTIFLFFDNQIYLTANQAYPVCRELPLLPEGNSFVFLFSIDDRDYFLVSLNAPLPDDCGLSLFPIRQVKLLRPMVHTFAGYTAWHLHNWYQSNRFCGRCGSEMVLGTDERKVVCPQCHSEVYPRINPSVIVAVHDKDRLLMTKYAGRPVSWFVLIAGFIEIGETAEDTVRREVLEETGVRVKNIRYYGSQPWGIPGNLTLGFTAELDGSDEITLDTEELAEGRWFDREEVPVPDDEFSITSSLIHAFANHEF